MAICDYINIRIDDELKEEAMQLLDDEEEYDIEDAIISALDKHFWNADTLGILHLYGNLDRLKETAVYREAVDKLIADIAEELKG